MRRPLSDVLIEKARYVGSCEHKARAWWGGLPKAYVGPDGQAHRPGRQMTTICPKYTAAERDIATDWVQKALQSGQFRYYEADKDFPKHIWYRDAQHQLWFGFCLNGVLGQYKGWPIEEAERVEIFG